MTDENPKIRFPSDAPRRIPAYRGFADRAQDPIFDRPVDARGVALHETVHDGYPHLLFAGDAQALRDAVV